MIYSSAEWDLDEFPGPIFSDGNGIRAWSLNVGEPNGVIFIDRLFRFAALRNGSCDFAEFAEIAKNYSKETEYCEENMESLITAFAEVPFFSLSALEKLIHLSFGENVDNI